MVHPDGAILIGLAVYEKGIYRILRQYRPIGFVSISDDDPVVLSQPGETIEVKQIAAYADMLKRYSRYLREDCGVLGLMAKVWAAERLAGIENQLSVLNPNRLELHLEDVVREAVPLKDQLIFQESAQVDLAVEPSGISRVRRLCELVEFKRLSEDDPIIQMQPGADHHMRKFNRYSHVLRRYEEARALRQIDGALMLWYEKEIMELETHIGRLGYV
ncbi:hypothetical protein BBP40_010813 [Aspergillus hancockii]|nr:hypothetical protein BBP40_010813 [Aspergillus hancockii]